VGESTGLMPGVAHLQVALRLSRQHVQSTWRRRQGRQLSTQQALAMVRIKRQALVTALDTAGNALRRRCCGADVEQQAAAGRHGRIDRNGVQQQLHHGHGQHKQAEAEGAKC